MLAVAKAVVTVSVRQLVEFVLRTGDLGGDGTFVGPNRALAGTRGHQQVQRSRPAGYQKEIRLSFDLPGEEVILRVQGRLDGLLVTETEVWLEEIKTIQGPWDHNADPLHWAQAKIYGFIYAQEQALPELELRLTYLVLESGELTQFSGRFTLVALQEFFAATASSYLEWVEEQHRWWITRDQSIQSLRFPYASYRPGQRDMAVAAFRALQRDQRLFVEAPTGIGKTMSVLFPAVKTLAERKVERLFYLTARTTTQGVAEKAFSEMRQAGLRLRTLTLTAREKLCVQQGQPCDLAVCPLARGYYDRCKPAIRAGLELEQIDRAALEQLAERFQVCPFALSLDISSWVDAVVCDYNYVFDPQAYLRRHFGEETTDYVFLIDEAHNLVDRGREMFSAQLAVSEIQRVRRLIQKTIPRCARALSKLSVAIQKLSAPTVAETPDLDSTDGELNFDLLPTTELNRLTPSPAPGRLRQGRGPDDGWVLSDLPTTLMPLLEVALRQAETWLIKNEAADFSSDLLELYFRLTAFSRVAERFSDQDRVILTDGPRAEIKLFCLDPSKLLRQALARGKGAIFFSATLSPMRYYQQLLGGELDDPALQLSSPFPSEHLAVLMHDRIRTDFNSRAASLPDAAAAIGALVSGRIGNYMVYLPSYQYLAALLAAFQRLHPATRVLAQQPGMTDAARAAFLASFATEPQATQVGFAVMGGIFSEGVDLVGDRLIGAIIVGVGLPQICLERDLIRDYFQERIGTGFDYAYRFPGMNRVLQATGRVIRSETDRGVVLLLDVRFAEPSYRPLIPRWWRPARVRYAGQIQGAVRQFWNGADAPDESAAAST